MIILTEKQKQQCAEIVQLAMMTGRNVLFRNADARGLSLYVEISNVLAGHGFKNSQGMTLEEAIKVLRKLALSRKNELQIQAEDISKKISNIHSVLISKDD